MSFVKKIILVFVVLLVFIISTSVNVKADEQLYLSDGTAMYYKGTNTPVMIPDGFKMQDTYLRGCWVTPLAGCLPSCSDSSITKYKNEINEMFEMMEYYNLNCLIFHIRIMNDALYPSELNPKSSYMSTSQDLLPWVIDECHKRGIEFHAWLNPYRVKSSGGTTASEEAAKIKAKCPANVGSNPDNLLINSSGGVILNPGIPEVRKFIVDTCMEVIEKYDVDAIHFDDYFYITDVDDSATRAKYNTENLELGDFRRKQVDLFIEDLSKEMRKYNEEHNRFVQLGISPSGIYRNGDGVVTYDNDGNAITTGSKTGGMQHWGNYLYSDTVNWINHEWIDYIMPQSYWAFSQPIAGFADVMSWWDKVCAKKKVNLYSGMGIYMSEKPGSNYSWGFDPNEAPNQILYTQTLSHTQGTVFYSYNYLEWGRKDQSTLYGQGLAKIKAKMFTSPAILPVIRTMKHVDISPVSGLSLSSESGKNIVTFDKNDNAKFYVIYRSLGEVTLAPEEVIAIIGNNDVNGKITYVDNANNDKYNYAVRVQAGNNELSEARFAGLNKYKVEFTDFDGKVIDTQYVFYGGNAIAPTAPTRSSEFKGWGTDFSYVTTDLVVNAKYADSLCHIKYLMDDGTLISEEDVIYGSQGNPTPPTKVGYDFVSWDLDITSVIGDIMVTAIFEAKTCHITFKDYDGKVIDEYDIKYGKDLHFPAEPERRGYIFTGWDDESKIAKGDMEFIAKYDPQYFTLTLVSKIDDSVFGEIKVQAYTDAVLPEPPAVKGYTFLHWMGSYTNVKNDGKVYAVYDENCYNIKVYDASGNLKEEIEHFYLDPFTYPEHEEVPGVEFLGWSFDINDLDKDLDIDMYPMYYKKGVKVTFVDQDNNVLSTVTLNSSSDKLVFPTVEEKEGKVFTGWLVPNGYIFKEDTTIKAGYEITSVTVTYLDNDGNEIGKEIVPYGGTAKGEITIPEVKGYKFIGFDKELTNLSSDITVKLVYEVIAAPDVVVKGCKKGSILNLLLSLSLAFGVCLIIRKKH